MRVQAALVSFALLVLSPVSTLEAETICRCHCSSVAGGKVCSRYCLRTPPSDFDVSENDWEGENNLAEHEELSQPDPGEEEVSSSNVFEADAPEEDPRDHESEPDYASMDEMREVAPQTPDEPPREPPASKDDERFVADESNSTKSDRSFDPETRALIREVIIGGVSMVVGAGALRFLSRLSAIARIRRDIATIGRRTRSAQEVDKKLRHAAREADILIERYRRQFYRQGYDQ